MQRVLYAIVGAVLVLFLDLCVNLLAGAAKCVLSPSISVLDCGLRRET